VINKTLRTEDLDEIFVIETKVKGKWTATNAANPRRLNAAMFLQELQANNLRRHYRLAKYKRVEP
jgi:hypothetical protein